MKTLDEHRLRTCWDLALNEVRVRYAEWPNNKATRENMAVWLHTYMLEQGFAGEVSVTWQEGHRVISFTFAPRVELETVIIRGRVMS